MALLELLTSNPGLEEDVPYDDPVQPDLSQYLADQAFLAAEDIACAHPISNEPGMITTTPIEPDAERFILDLFNRYGRPNAQTFVNSSIKNLESGQISSSAMVVETEESPGPVAVQALAIRTRERGREHAGWNQYLAR